MDKERPFTTTRSYKCELCNILIHIPLQIFSDDTDGIKKELKRRQLSKFCKPTQYFIDDCS